MVDKVYVISCSQDMAKIGLDKIRTAVSDMNETVLSLDWSKSRLVPVVAAERRSFQVGEIGVLSIRPIPVEAYSMVFDSFYGVNGMGHLLCIGAPEFKSFREARVATVAMFQSRIKSSIMVGDLLGLVIIVPGRAD